VGRVMSLLKRASQRATLVAAIAILSLASAGAQETKHVAAKYDVSKIGERGIGAGMNLYSFDKEIALGKQLALQLEQSAKLINDPVVTEYVNRIGQNIVRNSDA
jgi:predicted Zn-dependent protease